MVYEHDRKSYIRIVDFPKALRGETNPEGVKEIEGPRDHSITQASWGPLNKSIYIATDKGKFLVYDLEQDKYVLDE